MFSKLGDEEVTNDEQCADAQKLVCSMYGQKKLSSVAEARLQMFLKKYKPKIGKNPISCATKMDGRSLPSCSPVILQKLRRTNYVCSVWLNAPKASIPKFLSSECGWVVQDDCYRLKWYDGEVEDICHDDSENDICCSGLKGRRPFRLLNTRLRGGGGFCFGFLLWRWGGVGGIEGDGCSRWSVTGGDDGVLLMIARTTVSTASVC